MPAQTSDNNNASDTTARGVRSFVRREGRITKGQKRALEELLPVYSITLGQGPLDPVELFAREAPLTVEIGFGDGGALVEMASAQPETNFIGAEVYRPGVGKLLLGVADNELTNVRVYADDATDLLRDGLTPESVDTILIYFPDPWPKKKHLKRRLVQEKFTALAASRLRPGGILHVATDIESYAEQTREMLDACESLQNTAAHGGYCERPRWRPLTKYERRGTRLGHGVYDLIYTRVQA